jgi:hypothetical protein
MIVSSRHEGRIAIFTIQGRFTLGPMLARSKPRILAALASNVMRRGIRIALAQADPRIAGMFAITRLDGIFTVFDTEASALEYLANPQVPNQP